MATIGRVAIIGAGPTGLGAAFRLKEQGHDDFTLYEAGDRVGGLAASHVDERGFTWDVGGHVQFSHYPYFDALMDRALPADGWLNHRRQSWVWLRGRFVPYPFQYNIHRLPEEDLRRCLDGLAARPRDGAPANFGAWIDATFGRGIAELFLRPYNRKVWAYPPERLGYRWVGERVAVVDEARVNDNVRLRRDDTGWGPNSTFRFPRRGGTGAVWEAVADLVGRDKIRLRSPVTAVSARRRTVTLSDGSGHRYDALLNTMPLDRFAAMVSELSPEVKRRACGLKHSSTHVVGVGLAGRPKEELADKCWIYFPEDDCPFYRVTLFSRYSPLNVPDPERAWSLLTETSESAEKPVDGRRIVEQTISGLLATRLISSREDIVSVWHHRVEHGYPTPALDRDEVLSEVQPALEALGLFSRGRFGAWLYEASNQDHSVMQGAEWVDRILSGKPETTWRPA